RLQLPPKQICQRANSDKSVELDKLGKLAAQELCVASLDQLQQPAGDETATNPAKQAACSGRDQFSPSATFRPRLARMNPALISTCASSHRHTRLPSTPEIAPSAPTVRRTSAAVAKPASPDAVAAPR